MIPKVKPPISAKILLLASLLVLAACRTSSTDSSVAEVGAAGVGEDRDPIYVAIVKMQISKINGHLSQAEERAKSWNILKRKEEASDIRQQVALAREAAVDLEKVYGRLATVDSSDKKSMELRMKGIKRSLGQLHDSADSIMNHKAVKQAADRTRLVLRNIPVPFAASRKQVNKVQLTGTLMPGFTLFSDGGKMTQLDLVVPSLRKSLDKIPEKGRKIRAHGFLIDEEVMAVAEVNLL